jgi:hypothetical protein
MLLTKPPQSDVLVTNLSLGHSRDELTVQTRIPSTAPSSNTNSAQLSDFSLSARPKLEELWDVKGELIEECYAEAIEWRDIDSGHKFLPGTR